MNNFDKLNLQKMINTNDVMDETENIRTKKHSDKIKEDIIILLELKKKYFRLARTNVNEFNQLCISRCNFLHNNYTDIFNKVKNDEIDLSILYEFLYVLKEIEDSKIDQHEGSFKVGKLLKHLYIDSALKKSEKLEKINDNKKINLNKLKKISWSEYKEKNLENN